MIHMNSKKFKIESGKISGINWSVTASAKQGERQCGDTYCVEKNGGKVLLAAIDGLGHGESAAHASTRAKYLIKECNNESMINVVNYCHKNLRNTRGVVMTLAFVNLKEQTLTWIGVGNVKGYLLSQNGSGSESIVLRHGIVGYNLTSLQASVLPISVGDVLIFTTDGVNSGFINTLDGINEPNKIVEHIASDYFKQSDDSLVLAARFVGEESDEKTQ